MERNVPTERDFYQNGIVLSRRPYHWRGKEAGKFKKNIEDQKVKILVLTIATQNLCAFMSTIEINIIIFKYILKQNRMLQNLLVLFRSTRSTLVKSYCYTKSIKITNIIVVYQAILLILVGLIK